MEYDDVVKFYDAPIKLSESYGRNTTLLSKEIAESTGSEVVDKHLDNAMSIYAVIINNQ